MHIISLFWNDGVINLLILSSSVVWMLKDPKDKTRPFIVFGAILYLLFGILMNLFMAKEGALFPLKFDYVLFQLDKSLGISTAAVARPLQLPVCRLLLNFIYLIMIPVMILWFFISRGLRRRSSIIRTYITELVAGPLLYAIVPACGPMHAFGSQWLHPPEVAASPSPLTGFPNAFPSLHVGTAVAIVLLAQGRLWKAVAMVFLVGTAMATLATGEHYIIDLVPGLAFGCFAANAGLLRFKSSGAFLGLVLMWSLGVRFGSGFLIAHPLVTGALAAITICFAVADVVRALSTPQMREAKMTTAPLSEKLPETSYSQLDL